MQLIFLCPAGVSKTRQNIKHSEINDVWESPTW